MFALSGAFVAAVARPIADQFLRESAELDATVPFLLVVPVSLVGLGFDGDATGTLGGSGDARWLMYGRLIGRYGAVPVAYVGPVTPLGVLALYLARVVETCVPAGFTVYRSRTGEW